MKLRAVCTACSGELLLDQAISPGAIQGLCPWCGTALAPQYTTLLIEETKRVERAMDELLAGLRALKGMPRRFHLVGQDFTTRVREELGVTLTFVAPQFVASSERDSKPAA